MVNVILYFAAAFAVLAAGVAAYVWWQSSIKAPPYEAMFEIRQGGPARVRRGDGEWVITSLNGSRPVTLRAGTSPDSLSAPQVLSPGDGGYRAAATHDPSKRYFFEIGLDDGRTHRTAERVMPMEGPSNFRDLGGYLTADGRHTAWGKVFRSDELYRLSDNDVAIIRELGTRLFCDLRMSSEAKERPDRVPDGVAYLPMPIFEKDPIGWASQFLARHRLDAIFKRMYTTSIIDEGAPVLGQLLRRLADPANLPLVFHCAGGKDRTGMAAALILHICGVPRETIVVDYSLTNLAADRLLAVGRETFNGRGTLLGLKIEQMYPLFSARPELIEHAFDHIDATYGSVDAYLRGAVGLAEEEIEGIRRNLVAE